MCLGVSSGPTTSGNLASNSASGAGTPRRMRKPAASRSGCALGSAGLPVDGGRRPRTPPESPPSSVCSPRRRGGASNRSPRKPRSKLGRARSAVQARSGPAGPGRTPPAPARVCRAGLRRVAGSSGASRGSKPSSVHAAPIGTAATIPTIQGAVKTARLARRPRPQRIPARSTASPAGSSWTRPGTRSRRLPRVRPADDRRTRGPRSPRSGGLCIDCRQPAATPTGQWWEDQPSVRQLAMPQRGAELVRRLALLVLVITR
jgi:hypothetical protein